MVPGGLVRPGHGLTSACRRPLIASAPTSLRLLPAPEARRAGVPRQTGTMSRSARLRPRRASQPRGPRVMRAPRERGVCSVARGPCWQGREPRKRARPGCRRAPNTRQATAGTPLWPGVPAPGGGAAPWQARHQWVRDSGGPASALGQHRQVRTVHRTDTTVMPGRRESDRALGPTTRPNTGSHQPCSTRRPRAPRRRAGRAGKGPRATRGSPPGAGGSAGPPWHVRWPGDGRQPRIAPCG